MRYECYRNPATQSVYFHLIAEEPEQRTEAIFFFYDSLQMPFKINGQTMQYLINLYCLERVNILNLSAGAREKVIGLIDGDFRA